MLRFLGFLTGSALTAALALAVVDPVTLESLRRSAATLFLGVDSVAPASTQMSAPAADDAVPPPSVGGGSPRSRLLAALNGAVSKPVAPLAAPGATSPDASAVTPLPPADRQPSAGPEWSSTDVADRAAPQAESPAPAALSGATGPVESGMTAAGYSGPDPARAGGFATAPAESGPIVSGQSGAFVAGTSGAGADRARVGAEAPAPTAEPAENPAAATPPAAATAPMTPPGASPSGASGANLEALPPPPGTGGAGGWHAFWTPFRSEASATGFARHLERATGESYRVVRTGPGAYRVAFWHEGEDERSRRLLAIEQASGLSLRGGTL
jgi:hypothetical protein